MFFKKKQTFKDYDRQNLKPVIQCSICTGEQTAGFQNIHTGRFTGISLIRSEQDLENFMNTYGIETIEKIY